MGSNKNQEVDLDIGYLGRETTKTEMSPNTLIKILILMNQI